MCVYVYIHISPTHEPDLNWPRTPQELPISAPAPLEASVQGRPFPLGSRDAGEKAMPCGFSVLSMDSAVVLIGNELGVVRESGLMFLAGSKQ